MIQSEWGTSENNRRAKFYELTRNGEARLERETSRWTELVEAVSNVLVAQPNEV
jgi:DNA-binding PadR family transcriptional regulator